MPKTFHSAHAKCVWTIIFALASFLVAQDSVLHIKVVTGDSAQNTAGAHAKPLTVEVTDTTGCPVAGARVSFQVPEDGPGGLFANGLRTDISITDSSGHATEHGLQLNQVTGAFTIRITVAKDQVRAGTIARQSIGNADTPQSAERKAPAPASKEPPSATPPQRPAPPPPTITVPGTTATGPVKVATQQSPAATVRTAAEPVHGVPTIIVTQKSSKSITEVGADSGHKSHKKWIWIGLVAAGGAGAAFAASSMSSAAAHGGPGAAAAAGLSSSGVIIGTPTITIGKP